MTESDEETSITKVSMWKQLMRQEIRYYSQGLEEGSQRAQNVQRVRNKVSPRKCSGL